jgi:hypothetical protein
LINDFNRLSGNWLASPRAVGAAPIMPHYYFHVSNGTGETRDEEGSDLPDVESARVRALVAIRSILGEELHRGLLDFDGSIRITDRDDHPVLEVRFAEAVEVRYRHDGA